MSRYLLAKTHFPSIEFQKWSSFVVKSIFSNHPTPPPPPPQIIWLVLPDDNYLIESHNGSWFDLRMITLQPFVLEQGTK